MPIVIFVGQVSHREMGSFDEIALAVVILKDCILAEDGHAQLLETDWGSSVVRITFVKATEDDLMWSEDQI